MFVAQILHESGSLQHKKEWQAQQPETLNCPNSYRTPDLDVPGQYYYGRGYIQLTWAENYRECSKALYGDEQLLKRPDLVSDTEEGCWGSALWYWKWRVHNVWRNGFQATTMAINGDMDCASRGGPYAYLVIVRFEKYKNVCASFGLNPIGQAAC